MVSVSAGPRRLWLAPPLTAGIVARPEITDRLLDLVCADDSDPVGITGVHGTGGFGKTTLAKWICHEPRTKQRFPGGLLWVTLGEQVAGAELAARVNDLVVQLTGLRPALTDPLQAGFRLGEVLDAQPDPMLLVIDDAWTDQQVEPFLCGGRRCRRLLTTRHRRLVDPRNSVPLDRMTAAQAAALLTRDIPGLAGRPVDRVVAATGRWPVLLTLANRALVRAVDYGTPVEQALQDVADRLDEDGPVTFDLDNVHDRGRAVRATVRASLDLLPADTVEQFREMAVFSEDADVPVTVLEMLWATSARKVRVVCQTLADLALVLEYRQDAGTVRLHDVIRSYLIHEAGEPGLRPLHARLLDAAAQTVFTASGPAWWDLPEQHDYLIRHFAEHVLGAGQPDYLAATVTDLRWIAGRLRRHGPAGAEADLARVPTDIARLLGRKIRQNAHLLTPIVPEHALAAVLVSRLDFIATFQSTISEHVPGLPTPRLANRWPLPDLPHPALLRTFTGHTDRITALAVAPDGSWIATGGGDHTVRIWNPGTGATEHVLTGHTSEITAIATASDGRWLATGSADHTVRLWDPATGALRQILAGHTGPVTALAVPAPGGSIASAGDDRTVRLWDTATGDCRSVLTGHTDRLTALAVAPDGRWIAGAGQDHTVCLWDTETGHRTHVLEGHTNWIACLAAAPDDAWLASAGGDSTVRIWDPATGAARHVLRGHTGIVCAMVAGPGGAWLATASHDNTVRIWDPATGRCRQVLSGHTDWVVALAIVAGAEPRLATAGHDRTVRLWDPSTGECTGVCSSHTDRITVLATAPTGQWMVTAGYDRTARTWEPVTSSADAAPDGHSDRITELVSEPGGTWLATASQDLTVRIWDAATGSCRQVISGHGSPIGALAVAPDGTWLAASSVSSTRIWEPLTGLCRHVLKGHHDSIRALAVAPDGTWLATGSADTTVRIWDPATGSCRHVLGHGSVVGRLAVSPQGDWLAAGCLDGTVRIWDPVTGGHRHDLTGHGNWVGPPVPAPDGSWLATGSGDFTVRVWDPVTGACRHVFGGHHGWISGLVVAPDGSWLAAGSAAGSVRIWDLTSGACRHVLTGHDRSVSALTIAPDGGWIAAVSREGTITVWRPDEPAPVAAMRVDAALTTCVALPDGTGISAGSAGGAVYTFDLVGR
ncbi:NB-ARC domain-containing protein [Actinoplanes sp. CA-051413]|uniref:NB-ARC domain-containing protein n=1 Tax=Actinoplanes sp. CA-051413 TaxID=3239899 RepID=UPI003D979598